MIDDLEPNQVFVFGSNMNGNHAGGAARQAADKFGAEHGISEGLTGQSYAFPTLEPEMTKRGVRALEKSRDRLYATARALPEKEFLLTPVGTGIAGYDYREIEALFDNPPPNVVRVGWRS